MIKNLKIFLLIGWLTCTCTLSAQQLNTPEDFEKIMQFSSIKYFHKSDTAFVPILKVLLPTPLSTSQNTAKILKKSSKFFTKKDWTKAIKYYQKALEREPDNASLLRQLGIVYFHKENYTPSLAYFKKALTINSLDFMTLTYMADCYMAQGQQAKALQCITKAHIYNRNDAEILKKMIEICAANRYIYQNNWHFYAGYNAQKIGTDSILIHSKNIIWTAYANCKTVWENDKLYEKSKENDFPKNIDLVEEKECLLNFLMVYETVNEDEQKKVQREALKLMEALNLRMENAFIIYEVWAVKNPEIMHQLSEEKIELINEYIFTIRTAIMKNGL